MAKQEKFETWTGAVLIPIDRLVPTSFNVNEMDEPEFAVLVEEIRDGGFDEPCQVVPIKDGHDAGKYLILGGEHRYKACFPSGTRLTATRGSLDISEVRVGDRVLTHTGEFKSVTAVSQRLYEGRFSSVRVAGIHEPVFGTSNHPMVVGRSKERKALGDLKVGDLLFMPAMATIDISSITIPNELYQVTPRFDCCTVDDCQNTVHAGTLCFGHYRQAKCYKRKTVGAMTAVKQQPKCSVGECTATVKSYGLCTYHTNRRNKGAPNRVCLPVIPKNYTLDIDLLWALGLYVAEGCRDASKTRSEIRGALWTLGTNDLHRGYVARLVSILGNKFGLTPNVDVQPKVNKVEVEIYNPSIGNWLESLFGCYARNKSVPAEWLLLPKEKLQALWDGIMDGDGHRARRTLTTTSRALADQFAMMSIKLGMRARVYHRPPNTTTGDRQAWHVACTPVARAYKIGFDDSGVYLPVQEVTQSVDKKVVYNLTVEPTHSYVINSGIAVWNCTANGIEGVPCVIKQHLTDADEATLMEWSVKRNNIRGKLNKQKYAAIEKKLSGKWQISAEAARRRMLVRQELTKGIKEKLDRQVEEDNETLDADPSDIETGVKGPGRAVEEVDVGGVSPDRRRPPREGDETDGIKDQKKSFANRRALLASLKTFAQEVLSESAETVENGYLYFAFGGAQHLVVEETPKLNAVIADVVATCKANSDKINDFLISAITKELPQWQ